jgi:DNA-binding NarL/FixJ family response regulator
MANWQSPGYTASMRLLVAEDSEPFLMSVLQLCRGIHRLQVVAVSRTVAELRAHHASSRVELYLLDYRLADGTVLEFVREHTWARGQCAVMTLHPTKALEQALQPAGIAELIDKADFAQLESWLRTAAAPG